MRRFERPSIPLDGTWDFIPDAEQVLRMDALPVGQPIGVPGCWEAQVERPYHILTAWYRRRFTAPEDWAGAPSLVRFGAVMYHCRVWLNGRLLGEHEGGYTEFTLDTAGAIRAGANELVVRVSNPLNAIAEYPALAVERALLAEEWFPDLPLTQAPHGKQTWYSSQSGIWRSVVVERVGTAWLESARLLPDLAGSRAELRWETSGSFEAVTALRVRLTDAEGRDVGEHRLGAPEAWSSGAWWVPVPDPVPWSPGSPRRYTAQVELLGAGDEPLDTLGLRFGMRSIGTRDGRLLLNGEPLYVRGALDQDLYPETISTPPDRAYLERQFRLVREMGFNLLRCHIKSPDPLYAEVADELGVLLWCELPNWTVFSDAAATRGRRTLRDMVVAMGNHPSIVIWTIINEDWGTDLRYEARDRLWLSRTFEWLRGLDPSRLIVDNSACDTPQTPNFHVRTDIADFHTYFASPDNAHRWRNWVEEYARRPAFLWSPHEDAAPTGHEPLLLSEFGSWGLPDPARWIGPEGRQPWWFGTGQTYYRPAGVRRRFERYGLDRVWPDVSALAESTQWHQFENFQYQVAELRRHDAISGYVVTELTDATWEANGMLDLQRGPKVFHGRLPGVNGPDAAVTDLARRDAWGGTVLEVPFWVASYGEQADGGAIEWVLDEDGAVRDRGSVLVRDWPTGGAAFAGIAEVRFPEVEVPTDAWLRWRLRDADGADRGGDAIRLAIMPPLRTEALGIAVHDPLDTWSIAERVHELGYRDTTIRDADLLVAAGLDEAILDHAQAGGRVLVLVRTSEAVPSSVDLGRRVGVHLRRYPHAGWPGQRSPWEGDWVTAFSWMAPELQAGLPQRAPLDFAYTQVLPDHVLVGYDPPRHGREVAAGMFVGWVHTPAALEWTFAQGLGQVTLTTFRVAPERGPVADTLFARLIARAAGGASGGVS